MSPLVRRAILTALIGTVALAGVAAGCGSEGVTAPVPQTVIGALPKAAPIPKVPAFSLKGDPTAGKAIFAKSGCGGCHTLKAAGSTGTVGPNLDQLKPSYQAATARITLGKSPMPAFKGQLTDQQIADVAAFVVTSTGGTVP